MTRAAIEKVYRLTQHAQLLHTSAAGLTNTTSFPTITTTIATTISQMSTTIKTLAIGAALLSNGSNFNSNLRFNNLFYSFYSY